MLEWNYAINLALAGVLTVPMLAEDVRPEPGVDATTTAKLERSLGKTLRALEMLSEIEKRAGGGDPRASAFARHVTELAIGDVHECDQRLATLRGDASRPRMQSDGLDARALASAKAPVPTPASDVGPALARSHEIAFVDPAVTTGLCNAERRVLSLSAATSVAAGTRSLSTPNGAAAPSTSIPSARPNPEALAADPLRHAQACYRAGHYVECLALMKVLGSDVRARYWTGRALEKLDRITEAIAVYREVSLAPDAGYLAMRAAGDLDYLQWRVAVAERLAKEAEAARATRSKLASKSGKETRP